MTMLLEDPALLAAATPVLQLGTEVLGQTLDRWIGLLIAAFAGGVLGAALGALPAFVFMGFVIIGGEAIRLAGINTGGQPIVAGWTNSLAFGAFFGPHITFAAGAAASAYAAKKGYMEEGFGGNWGYHDGKNILIAFASKFNDVLLVGGVFGIVGYLIVYTSASIGAPWDPIAMGVVLSALIHRVAFGYHPIGEVRADGWLDTSPIVEERTAATDGGGGKPAERLLAEPWLPWHYKWSGVALIGIAFGVLGGLAFYVTGSLFLAFGFSAATLVFLNLGITDDYAIFQVPVPVTHHVTLPASAAPAAYAGLGVTPAVSEVQDALLITEVVIIAGIFGLVGALLGELSERIFYMHGDTHWDPPATSIVVTSLLIAILGMLGIFDGTAYVPTPG